jgi:hypothetical protein
MIRDPSLPSGFLPGLSAPEPQGGPMIDPDHFHQSIAVALEISQKEIDRLLILKKLRQEIEAALGEKGDFRSPALQVRPER